ncbi:MAG TPA: hypothetical protein VHE33_11160 [Acidobacteriaceae bacterium]|nr:hypothetical protein [Acidobacteriaceae bacterium]
MRFWFRFPATPSSDATRAQRRRSLLLATVLIAVLPLAWRGASCGQDFDFHLQSWLEVVNHWHHGILYPHWAASANYQAGEPRFVFYPPLSWMLGGVLGLVLPWSWTPVAYVLVALLGAGFAFRQMAREWMPLDSATIAACLYVVNPYMMFVVYERGALAELLAAIWIPLIVLFALRDRPAVVPLGVTVAALWLSDAPAAVLGCYALVPLVGVAALRERSWRLMARSAAAVPLGLALAGFWLVPAIYQERWVQIHRAIGPLMRVEDSFLFGYVSPVPGPVAEGFNAVYHNGVLQMASWIAVALIVVGAVAAWLSRRRANALWAPLVGLAGLIVFLQFRWSDPLWRYLPELRYLQFPWRWLLVFGLVATGLAGLAMRREQTTRRAIAVRGAVVLLVACGMALLSSLLFWQPCDEEDNIGAQIATFHATGFQGTDEYTPDDAANSRIQQGLPAIRLLNSATAEESPVGDNPEWCPDSTKEIPGAVAITGSGPEQMSATVATGVPGFAVLRLMDYPAWRITVNGSALGEHSRRGDGLLVIPIAAGTTRIDVRWHLTADVWIGLVLTLLAVAITLFSWGKERRRPHANSF